MFFHNISGSFLGLIVRLNSRKYPRLYRVSQLCSFLAQMSVKMSSWRNKPARFEHRWVVPVAHVYMDEWTSRMSDWFMSISLLLLLAKLTTQHEKGKTREKKAEWKTLFIDSQIPDLSLHFNPKRKKERKKLQDQFILSLSLRLHFEVHKRIWLQHICAEAVLHCSSLVLLHFWSRATLCVGVYYPRLFDNSLYKNVEYLSKDLAGLSHACQRVTWLSATVQQPETASKRRKWNWFDVLEVGCELP